MPARAAEHRAGAAALLAEPDSNDVLTPEDQRGLTPLVWSHVLPYDEVKLNVASGFPLGSAWPSACGLRIDQRTGRSWCDGRTMSPAV